MSLYPILSLRQAQVEMKKRGWRNRNGKYIPPKGKQGITRKGLTFMEACSFEAICYRSPKAQRQYSKMLNRMKG